MADSAQALAGPSGHPRGTRKRRKFTSDFERREARKTSRSKYDKQRVFLGATFPEWEATRVREGFTSQHEFAKHLLAVHEARCMYLHADSIMREAAGRSADPPHLFRSFEASSDSEKPAATTQGQDQNLIPPTPDKSELTKGTEAIFCEPASSTRTDITPIKKISGVHKVLDDSPILSISPATSKRQGSTPVKSDDQNPLRLPSPDLSDIEEENLPNTDWYIESNNDDANDDSTDLVSFDDPDWTCQLEKTIDSPCFTPLKIQGGEAVNTRKCIAFPQCIEDLLKAAVGVECDVCGGTVVFKSSMMATCLVYSWICPKNEKHLSGSWSSQPRLHGMYAANLLVPAALVMSGNNYRKVALMAKFLNLGFVGEANHYRIQDKYVRPAAQKKWQQMQDELLQATESPVILGGDGRNDSPGHSAQYCTYSFMHLGTGKIVGFDTVDVREVDLKSPNMEKLGFERALAKIMSKVPVEEIVTDAHVQIRALLRKSPVYHGITHQFDVWHTIKNMTKKLVAAGKQRGCTAILQWVSAIRNHMWYCAMMCNGDTHILKESWVKVVHHVCNRHTWTGPNGETVSCDHPVPLPPSEQNRPWIKPGSPAHKELLKIIWDRNTIKNLDYIRNFRHTSWLEQFHSHLLMYCPKRNSYKKKGYELRNMLAAIDHNMHVNRDTVKDKDGQLRMTAKYSKASRTWTNLPMKATKDYLYIPQLLGDVVKERQESGETLDAPASKLPNDPSTMRPSIAAVPKPPPAVLRAEYECRQAKKKNVS